MFVSAIESVVSDTERLFCEVEHEEYQIFIEGDIIYTYVCMWEQGRGSQQHKWLAQFAADVRHMFTFTGHN